MLPPTERRREHVHPGTTVEAVEAYRSAFRPSPILRKPTWWSRPTRWSPTTTPPHASWRRPTGIGRTASARATARSRTRTHETTPPLTDEERALVNDRIVTQFVGAPSSVAERLDTLRRVTDADELVVTSVTHGHEDRLRSYELLAREWGLARVRAA